jgi:uncharacterized protein (TIGR02001 family)
MKLSLSADAAGRRPHAGLRHLQRLLVFSWLSSVTAHAQGTFGGSLTATSDYIYRGQSLTRGAPALQGELHYQLNNGLFAGVWASTIDLNPGPGAALELNAYLGRAWELDQAWDARVELNHYVYPDDKALLRYDYDEFIGTLSYQARISATIAWSPNTSNVSEGYLARRVPAISYELAATQPLSAHWSATLGCGHYEISHLPYASYWFGNAGLVYSLPRWQLSLMYVATDPAATEAFGYEIAGERWSGTLTWRF